MFLRAFALLSVLSAVVPSAFAQDDYRETVGPWFRSVFRLQPDVELMADYVQQKLEGR